MDAIQLMHTLAEVKLMISKQHPLPCAKAKLRQKKPNNNNNNNNNNQLYL